MAFTEFAGTGNAPRAGLSGAGAHRQQRWQRQKPATEDYDLMNALTLTLIRLAFLAVLWLFVIAAVGVVLTFVLESGSGHSSPTSPLHIGPTQQTANQSAPSAPGN